MLGADSSWTEVKADTPFSSSLQDLPFWDQVWQLPKCTADSTAPGSDVASVIQRKPA